MTVRDRKELIDGVAYNYIQAKKQNEIYQRENSSSYSIASGILQGVCMALSLDFEETKDGIIVFTRGRKKVITKIEL